MTAAWKSSKERSRRYGRSGSACHPEQSRSTCHSERSGSTCHPERSEGSAPSLIRRREQILRACGPQNDRKTTPPRHTVDRVSITRPIKRHPRPGARGPAAVPHDHPVDENEIEAARVMMGVLEGREIRHLVRIEEDDV